MTEQYECGTEYTDGTAPGGGRRQGAWLRDESRDSEQDTLCQESRVVTCHEDPQDRFHSGFPPDADRFVLCTRAGW